MGKLYVIESGSDAAGKQTQTKLLYEKLRARDEKTIKISFPNYDSRSSYAVKMYLDGDFGGAEEVNGYIASTFFALDRYITYKKEFEKHYNDGFTIIADRYSTSNMVYQGAKIDSEIEREKFLSWLYNLEHEIYSIPEPDKVIFLNMPIEISINLLKKREGEGGGDIHEIDKDYLKKVSNRSLNIAKKYGWNIVECAEDGKLLSVEEIHGRVMGEVDER